MGAHMDGVIFFFFFAAECAVVSKDDIDSFAPLLRAISSAGFSRKAAALLCLADTGALRSAPISDTTDPSLTVATLLLDGDKKFESIKVTRKRVHARSHTPSSNYHRS